MCFHSAQSKSAQELKNRFKAEFEEEYEPAVYNGFTHPKTPVIINTDLTTIKQFSWGLIPSWAKDMSFRDNTLNARIESIKEKPSFKSVINNRCLVLADSFFEWQWLDTKGKKKQKYCLELEDKEAFGFAGLWSDWVNKETGEIINTYTIITTEANELMSEIHNSKRRMPVILKREKEKDWLLGGDLKMDNDRLIAHIFAK